MDWSAPRTGGAADGLRGVMMDISFGYGSRFIAISYREIPARPALSGLNLRHKKQNATDK